MSQLAGHPAPTEAPATGTATRARPSRRHLRHLSQHPSQNTRSPVPDHH